MSEKQKSTYIFHMKIFFSVVFIFINSVSFSQTGWQQVTNFGTNPGNLTMYLYVPEGINNNAPIVVSMHGCTQNAVQCRDNTGWNDLADRYKFFVIYPEQKSINNSSNCFNWFLPGDQSRDTGESLSIKQMVNYTATHYTVDISKVFTTGLSAGAGMSAIMLACYPDIFSAGAILSGAPYKSATDAITAANVMYGFVNKSPSEWKNLVLSAYPGYTGSFPRVVIFHGLNDNVVSPVNMNESIEQWTEIHGISQTATATNMAFLGNNDIEQDVYTNLLEDTVVLTYKINNLFHAIAVDPGTGITQGGTTGTYSVDKNFYSSYWAAKFFGIISDPTEIKETLLENQITIYPNPAKNNISINFPGTISFELLKIYTIQNEFIKSSTNKQIDISELSAGAYIAEIQYNKFKTARKLIFKF